MYDASLTYCTAAFHSCGPAPLHAIKNGLTDLKHDIGFLFAAVNADVLHWLKVDMANWTVFKVEQSRYTRLQYGSCVWAMRISFYNYFAFY